ncbi:MAG: flagella basal body P-ring formation protein FlgA [Salinarimonadaceae bacterium]|nr:MAG: flagella basal body P-ring formation protein FlgA [Salinarimonadaceae bacterium]
MSLDLHAQTLGSNRRGRIGSVAILRAAALVIGLAVALGAALFAAPANAGERPQLRGDVTVRSDIVTFGDLVAGAPEDVATIPVFRAPGLGETGTIQTARIEAAAESLGFGELETYGRRHVNVVRAARFISRDEIVEALTVEAASRLAVAPETLSLRFDGEAPTLVVAPDVTEAVAVVDMRLDTTSRRLSAMVYVGPDANRRRAQAMVSASVLETVEIAILNRPIERGEVVGQSDVTIERRPRGSVPQDARLDGLDLREVVARRALSAGAALRSGDLVRPQLVGRNENVMIVYRTRNLTLTTRGVAREAGARGDIIPVSNIQSNRVLQATIVAPGQVVVEGPALGPIASSARRIQ